jgi:hypothetical protein
MTLALEMILPGSNVKGILGEVLAYYGCVEGQDRGTLHCHLVVWLYNTPSAAELNNRLRNSVEFRERLATYLDATIKRDASSFRRCKWMMRKLLRPV